MNGIPGVGGVVFDCDGVLAETTGCWDEAYFRTARGFGLQLRDDQLNGLRGAALSMSAERIVAWSRHELAFGEVLEVLHQELAASIDASTLVLVEGARALLQELHGSVRLGVASNAPRSILLRVLSRLDITQYFASAISAEDVKQPKPAPDPYIAACEALAIHPLSSFAIEDSAIGMQSAMAAGLAVIELAKVSDSVLPFRAGTALRVRSLSDPRIWRLVRGTASAMVPPSDPRGALDDQLRPP
jgi:HAD superfamily hydrolase (TIGR01509 family)